MQTELFPTLDQPARVDHMTTVPAVHRIGFRDTTLICLERDDELFVALRPVVEGMGLDWKSQHRKLMADSDRFCVRHMTTQIPGDDQRREMLCLPLRRLNGWLMSISPSKVRPGIRAAVIAYQYECDEVLFRHFFHDLHLESTALRLLRPKTVVVARLTLEGKSRREIASLLAISEAAVTYHRRSARRLGLLAA